MKIGSRFAIRDNRIVKVSNGEVLPLDEPLFLMRARDVAALPALRDYWLHCQEAGADEWQLSELNKELELFERFRELCADRMKIPGITHGR